MPVISAKLGTTDKGRAERDRYSQMNVYSEQALAAHYYTTGAGALTPLEQALVARSSLLGHWSLISPDMDYSAVGSSDE